MYILQISDFHISDCKKISSTKKKIEQLQSKLKEIIPAESEIVCCLLGDFTDNKVVILSFSGRKDGNCASITDFIEQFYMRTNVLSYKIDNESFPSCGGCKYECLIQGAKCPHLLRKDPAAGR